MSVPIIQLLGDVGTQHVLQDVVEALSLAISLGVEGRGHGELGPGQLEEGSPEVTGEAGVSVGDDDSGQSMMSEDSVEEEAGRIHSRNCCRCRGKVGHLAELVDENGDGVETIGWG